MDILNSLKYKARQTGKYVSIKKFAFTFVQDA